MVKNVFFALLQFVLFLLVCAAGIVLASFHLLPSRVSLLAGGMRGFQWDGILLMAILFGLILLIETARKRIRTSGPWTLIAFVAALALAIKFSLLSLT